MGNKKKHKSKKSIEKAESKNKKSQQEIRDGSNADGTGMRFLGMDAGELGAALAGALIGEITQAAMGKTAQKTIDPEKLARVRDAVRDMISAIRSILAEVKPVAAEAMNTVKDAIHDPKASASEVVDATREKTEVAGHTAANAVSHTVNLVKDIIEDKLEDVKSFPKRESEHQKN